MGRLKGPAALALVILSAMLKHANASRSEQLSPPWWVAYGMFDAALKSDPCLNISELQPEPRAAATFAFNVTVCAAAPPEKLAALAALLTVRYNFGGTHLACRVLDAAGRRARPAPVRSGRHALQLAGAALRGNTYFVRTAVTQPLPCMELYWVVFQPAIVQLWADNLADLYGNINLLAADVLGRVLGLEAHGLRATTLKFGELQARGSGGGDDAGGSGQGDSQRSRSSSAQEGRGGPQLHVPQRVQQQEQRQEGSAALLWPGRPQQSGRRVLGAPGNGRSWRCWVVDAARRLGGERLVWKVQRWALP